MSGIIKRNGIRTPPLAGFAFLKAVRAYAGPNQIRHVLDLRPSGLPTTTRRASSAFTGTARASLCAISVVPLLRIAQDNALSYTPPLREGALIITASHSATP